MNRKAVGSMAVQWLAVTQLLSAIRAAVQGLFCAEFACSHCFSCFPVSSFFLVFWLPPTVQRHGGNNCNSTLTLGVNGLLSTLALLLAGDLSRVYPALDH